MKQVSTGTSSPREQPADLCFKFNGRTFAAKQGETIGTALLRAGVHTLGRSIKFRRRLGIFCADGWCGNCLVEVDGIPNVRACLTRVTRGMQVRALRGFPSLEWDTMRTDMFSRFFPAGFQYRRFIRPRFLAPLYTEIVRRMAGYGHLPKTPTSGDDERRTSCTMNWDVVVIGGGIAGCAAAAAAATDLSVLLVERRDYLGGSVPSHDDRLRETLRRDMDRARVTVWYGARAIGHYQEDDEILIPVVQGGRILRLVPKSVVYATGSYDAFPLAPGNDLPGVLGGSAALNMVTQAPDIFCKEAPVVTIADRWGLQVLSQLAPCFSRIVAVVTPAFLTGDVQNAISEHIPRPNGIKIGTKVRAILGTRRVSKVIMDRPDGRSEAISCSLYIHTERRPAIELPRMAGLDYTCDLEQGGFVIDARSKEKKVSAVFAAGEVTGLCDDSCAIRVSGERAGHAAAAFAAGMRDGEDITAYYDANQATSLGKRASWGTLCQIGSDAILCPCEDVSYQDFTTALRLGYKDLETLRRFLGLGMGLCQGRRCAIHCAFALADRLGIAPRDVGIFTQRPPLEPLPFGLLAGLVDDKISEFR